MSAVRYAYGQRHADNSPPSTLPSSCKQDLSCQGDERSSVGPLCYHDILPQAHKLHSHIYFLPVFFRVSEKPNLCLTQPDHCSTAPRGRRPPTSIKHHIDVGQVCRRGNGESNGPSWLCVTGRPSLGSVKSSLIAIKSKQGADGWSLVNLAS